MRWTSRAISRYVAGTITIACLAGAAPAVASFGSLTQFGTPSGACLSANGVGGLCATGLTLNSPSASAATADNKFVYVVGGGNNQVDVLSRATTDGRLKLRSCVAQVEGDGCTEIGSGLDGPAGIAVSPNGKSVYVAASASSAVTTFDRNTTTGTLTGAGCISETLQDTGEACDKAGGLGGASAVAVSPDGKSVFVTGAEQGTLAVFARNISTGRLTQTGCWSSSPSDECTLTVGLGLATAVAVSPDNKSVYVTGAGGTIVLFHRNPNTLALSQDPGIADCIGPAGSDGCVITDAGTAGASGVTVSKDNKSVYLVAAGAGAVVTFKRSTTNGLLLRAGCVSDTGAGDCIDGSALAGATDVQASDDGKSVVVTSASGLVTLTRDTQTGALLPQSCFNAAGDDGCARGVGLAGPLAGVLVTKDGKSVYASSVTDDAVSVFVRRTSGAGTGSLTQLDRPPTACVSDDGTGGRCVDGVGLAGALGLAISKDAKYLYVAAQQANGVSIFARDTTTGKVRQQGCINETGSDGCGDGYALHDPRTVVATPDNKSVYVGTEGGTSASGYGSLVTFTRNTSTRGLTEVGCLDTYGTAGCATGNALSVRDIASSPNSKSLYVSSLDHDGMLTVYTRNTTTGALTQQQCVSGTPTSGCLDAYGLFLSGAVAVSPDAKTVYVGTDGGSIVTLGRNTTTGALTFLNCAGSGSGCFGDALPGVGTVTDLAVSPDNRTLYVASRFSGAGALAAFARNTTTGALTPVTAAGGCWVSAPTPGAAGCTVARELQRPASVVVSADNRSVYVGNADGRGIAVFGRVTAAGAGQGTLGQPDGSAGCINATGASGCASAVAVAGASALAISPNNKTLYAAAFGSSALASFARDTAAPPTNTKPY